MKYFVVASLLIFISCVNEPLEMKALQGNAFGTTYSVQYYPTNIFDAEKGIDSVIYAVNKSVSTYMPESDISKINEGDSTIVVDAIFKEVFRLSEVVYSNSQHYFDPTVGVLRNAYGFGDTNALKILDQKVIDSLMQFVGFDKVSIQNDGTILKEHPEIYFDFNAVAKGYGIDLIGHYLSSQGVDDYLIELGGEVVAKGYHVSKNKSWTVGVEHPDSKLSDRMATAAIKLDDKGMAGSGNYRKFRIDSLTGKKFVHTLNPLTGSANQNNMTSATVIASSCAEADAYATACMALGFDAAKKMIEQTEGVEAYLTYIEKDTAAAVFITEGFKYMMLDSLAL